MSIQAGMIVGDIPEGRAHVVGDPAPVLAVADDEYTSLPGLYRSILASVYHSAHSVRVGISSIPLPNRS